MAAASLRGMKPHVLVVSILLFSTACPAAPEQPAHHTDQGFINPYSQRDKPKTFFTYLKMRYFSDDVFADHAPDAAAMPVAEQAVEHMLAPLEAPKITWLGHSSFLIQYRGVNILTDPILSDRASPVFFAGPARLVAKPISLSELPTIDFVLISHNHYDHLDQFTIEYLGNVPEYLVPLRLKTWFEDIGIDGDRVHEFDWWDERTLAGIRFIATPAQHWSGRGPGDRYATLWASWRIEFGDFSTWFAGDTGYNEVQFKQVYQRYGAVDVALIPIGSYAPRWFMQATHVNPAEAIWIHNDLKAGLSIGMHWGTFQLSAEPFFEPEQKLNALVAAGALDQGQFITLKIGETRALTSLDQHGEKTSAAGSDMYQILPLHISNQ